MAVTLHLDREQEQQLQDIAEAKGLSVEGYLLTLIEAIIRPQSLPAKKGIFAAIQRNRTVSAVTPEPRFVADTAIRLMKADVLAYKEQAVAAMTKANLLRKITEQQQRIIAQKELQALTFARDNHPEQAVRCYQESCIYAQNLKHTYSQLQDATQTADELLSVFKREEAKMQARVSQTQAAALEAIEGEYAKSALNNEQIQKRISATATPEQWQTQFTAWVQSIAEPIG